MPSHDTELYGIKWQLNLFSFLTNDTESLNHNRLEIFGNIHYEYHACFIYKIINKKVTDHIQWSATRDVASGQLRRTGYLLSWSKTWVLMASRYHEPGHQQLLACQFPTILDSIRQEFANLSNAMKLIKCRYIWSETSFTSGYRWIGSLNPSHM